MQSVASARTAALSATQAYVGISAYCYANALSMSLVGAGADAELLGDAGFLECLTMQPFGSLLVRSGESWLPLFSSAAMNPDGGITNALTVLGWTCRDERDGDVEEATARLRRALRHGPALAGPLDMSLLTHNPRYAGAVGADHFVVVLGLTDESEQCVRFHDPGGFPFATLPLSQFLEAWRAERIDYGAPYTLRSAFSPVERRSRSQIIDRTLPAIRPSLIADPGGPDRFGGVRAIELTVELLQQPVSARLAGHLTSFALPLAARRRIDAAAFLREAGNPQAGELLARQAGVFGSAQYRSAMGEWLQVRSALSEIAALERQLIASL